MTSLIKLFVSVHLILLFVVNANCQKVEIDGCSAGEKKAKQLIAANVIYFPRLIVESSLTLRKLLEIEYGIRDAVYSNGSCLQFPNEAECFYRLMLDEIEKKRGKNFLPNLRRIANELDSEGKGYIESKENNIHLIFGRYVKGNAPIRDPKKGYLIILKISPDRAIADIDMLFGIFNPSAIERTSEDYLYVKDVFNKITHNCEPAQFRGKSIESEVSFFTTF